MRLVDVGEPEIDENVHEITMEILEDIGGNNLGELFKKFWDLTYSPANFMPMPGDLNKKKGGKEHKDFPDRFLTNLDQNWDVESRKPTYSLYFTMYDDFNDFIKRNYLQVFVEDGNIKKLLDDVSYDAIKYPSKHKLPEQHDWIRDIKLFLVEAIEIIEGRAELLAGIYNDAQKLKVRSWEYIAITKDAAQKCHSYDGKLI